jgi:hypothetical protein
MTTMLSVSDEDPFVATTENGTVNWMLGKICAERWDEWPGRDGIIANQEWSKIFKAEDSIDKARPPSVSSPPIGGTRRAEVQKKYLRSLKGRLLTAAVGAVFLIGPMWLMVLHHTRYTSLISTSVFVGVFGMLMARSLEKPMEVLTSTAAYAAVLVVFVGTNSP